MSKRAARKARWAGLRGDYATAGDLYRLAGEPEKALRMYRKGRLYRLAAQVADELGDFEQASLDYERGGLPLEAAEAALRAGDRERAARLFVTAGQTRRAAEIQEAGGRPAAAARLYELSGDLRRAARLFLDARQPERALRAIEKLLRDSGLGGGSRRELLELAARGAKQLLAAGEPARAAGWLERAGKMAEAARAWERAGDAERAIRAWLASGQAERAAEVAERAFPDRLGAEPAARAYAAAEMWGPAATLFLEAGLPGEAAACFEKLGCPVEAAAAYEAAGDPIAAAERFEQAGDLASAARLYRLAGEVGEAARCLESAGEIEAAAEAFLEAGERVRAARLLDALGAQDRALEILQAVGSDSPERPAAALALARLFERKGMGSVAVKHYREALAAPGTALDDSERIDAWYRLGTLLESLGRARQAAAAFKEVVARDYRFRDAAARLERLHRVDPGDAGNRRERRLPSRYAVLRPLDLGLPGEAFLALDATMEREVCLRRFGPDRLPTDAAIERVLGDVRRVARLHHPAIAAIHDAGRDDKGLFIVQEHVRGRSLRAILEAEGPLDAPRAVQVLTRVAEALDYAHGLGLLARVLRPESIIVTPSWEIKMIDFGLALRQRGRTGAPDPYRPPEANRGERMDPSSDVYLLGVLAWEMLAGSPPPPPDPSGGAPPRLPVAPDRPVPDLLQKVVSRCLAPSRLDRYGSAQQLLEELHGTSLLPGTLLANRYEILRELGRGGMGTVFAARDLVLDEPVALKVLTGPLDETVEKRFIQEIRLARQINHPNIVRVHTFERWRDLRFIVMEFIDGVDLRAWAASRRRIPLGQALDLAAGVAAGLAAAHRLGIVHRDVKPENVLIDAEGRPRLVDFGIARQGDVHLTREGLVIGSPAYMAPEQIRGEATDQRADLYALGILTYFLVTGREPFTSENVAEILQQQLEETPPPPSSLRPGVPAALDALLARVLAKDPNRRPPSVFAFLEELGAVRAALKVVTA
ncbi:MAG: serine/threonine protein kinase [Acidobacteria bacterium]|nr:MAG: serine/threonine protein kinase [Acidobacteriota bacterium]